MRSPEKVHRALQDLMAGGCLAGDVVYNPVLLEAVGAALVAPHSRADMGAADGVLGARRGAPMQLRKCRADGLRSEALVGYPLPACSDTGDASRDVCDAATVLMLVPVLAALASPAEPLNGKVALGKAVRPLGTLGENRNRHGRCVDPAFALGRWNALNAVAACFVVQGVRAGTGDAEDSRAVRARGALNPSSVASSQALVGRGQVLNEKLRVVAAFRGPNFDSAHPKNLSAA